MLKKICFYFFIVLFSASCSKDEGEVNGIAGKITCAIDGVDFTSFSTDVQQYSSFMLIGATSGVTLISINISDIKAGSYALNVASGNDATLSIITDSYTTSNFTDENAKLVITEVNAKDSTITGTFQFEATNFLTGKKIKVTNGKINNVKFVGKVVEGSTLSCNAGGKAFNAFNLGASSDNDELSISGSSLFFAQSLSLSMNANLGPGTYNIVDGTPINASYSDESSGLFGYSAKSGKLIIISHNKTAKTISGTFEFEGETSNVTPKLKKSIKDGKFNVSY